MKYCAIILALALAGCATKGYEVCDTPNCATATPVVVD